MSILRNGCVTVSILGVKGQLCVTHIRFISFTFNNNMQYALRVIVIKISFPHLSIFTQKDNINFLKAIYDLREIYLTAEKYIG